MADGSYWHHMYRQNDTCSASEVDNACLTVKSDDWWDNTRDLHSLEMGHWPPPPGTNDEMNEGHMEKSRSLYGTYLTQQAIYKAQNPSKSCSKDVKYLLVKQGQYMTGHGIGSLIHSLASSLALAIATGRVLIYDPNDGLAFATDSTHTSIDTFKCGHVTVS